ncbi:ABC transporter permease [Ureibacillus sp. GCM10028918]|uniref:ABC transporter permease n=1 Tax=Ureibacillus sp. GCM10028918 TaxID=3273429 RepID=UPI00360FFD8E
MKEKNIAIKPFTSTNFLKTKDNSLVQLFCFMIIIFLLMWIIGGSSFFSIASFKSISFQFPILGILSLAMMLTMISGGIDLSLVAISNLTSIVAALFMSKFIPADASGTVVFVYVLIAIVLSIIVGILCGFFNGFAISIIGIPAILVTLGTSQLFMGLAIVITKGQAVIGLPRQYSEIGYGNVLGIPFPLIIFVVMVAITFYLLNKRKFGIELQLMGANPKSSKYSGINNLKVTLQTYMISGAFGAVTGLLIIASTNSAKADFGTSYILQTILVAVLGGVSVKGGFGKVAGIVMAVLILQFLSTGLNALQLGNFFKDFIWGAVLLLIMSVKEISRIINKRKELKSKGRHLNEKVYE